MNGVRVDDVDYVLHLLGHPGSMAVFADWEEPDDDLDFFDVDDDEDNDEDGQFNDDDFWDLDEGEAFFDFDDNHDSGIEED